LPAPRPAEVGPRVLGWKAGVGHTSSVAPPISRVSADPLGLGRALGLLP
jgi:hypothetical protein